MNDMISPALIAWYLAHKRELPWRDTTDPYLIWISEVILQQTRVAQGLDYYRRFTGRFPDVGSLAGAGEDEVLKYWQGLGYYSRARSLHAAARQIVERFGGRFPREYEEVLSLRGVGEYTASAVCSFAYRQPRATVDGNVYRVLSRLFSIDLPIDGTAGKKAFAELAAGLLAPLRPDLHNQAIMEFGALQCVPRSPDCARCPLAECCLALRDGKVDALPVKSSKTAVLPRYFNYLHIRCQGLTAIARREGRDIWQGLYEFPLIETAEDTPFEALRETAAFQRLFEGAGEVVVRNLVAMPRHQLSHRTIHARFCELEIEALTPALQQYLIVRESELSGYAVSRLTDSYLERLGDGG